MSHQFGGPASQRLRALNPSEAVTLPDAIRRFNWLSMSEFRPLCAKYRPVKEE